MIETICAACGKTYMTFPRTLRRVKQPTCSKKCNGTIRYKTMRPFAHRSPKGTLPPAAGRKGSLNYAWKGGVTYFRKHGNYKPIKYVRCPEALLSMARKDGYVMEHRLIMATWMGRPLLRVEVVHHVDHDPQNNTRTNLELWPTNQAHKLHEGGRLVLGAVNHWRQGGALRSSQHGNPSSLLASLSAAPSLETCSTTARVA